MSVIQVPPLYEHSLIEIPIDPEGPDVELGEPHDIRFETRVEFNKWFEGQQRQCTYNRVTNEGPEALDAAAERMRRNRNQDVNGVFTGQAVIFNTAKDSCAGTIAPFRPRVPRDTKHEVWECQFAGMYTVQEQERRAAAHVAKVGRPVKPRKGKTTFKSLCRATVKMWYDGDHGPVRVSYQ
jgi:hypothetical protein